MSGVARSSFHSTQIATSSMAVFQGFVASISIPQRAHRHWNLLRIRDFSDLGLDEISRLVASSRMNDDVRRHLLCAFFAFFIEFLLSLSAASRESGESRKVDAKSKRADMNHSPKRGLCIRGNIFFLLLSSIFPGCLKSSLVPG